MKRGSRSRNSSSIRKSVRDCTPSAIPTIRVTVIICDAYGEYPPRPFGNFDIKVQKVRLVKRRLCTDPFSSLVSHLKGYCEVVLELARKTDLDGENCFEPTVGVC